MAIKLNAQNITTNKINGQDVVAEKVDGVSVWPMYATQWVRTTKTNYTVTNEDMVGADKFDTSYAGCYYMASPSLPNASNYFIGTIIRTRAYYYDIFSGGYVYCSSWRYYEAQ